MIPLIRFISISALIVTLSKAYISSADRHMKKDAIRQILFPNRTYLNELMMSPAANHDHRRLLIPPPADLDMSGPCSVCSGLKYCSVLNGLMVEERYYITPQPAVGTCAILESLGSRMADGIFGVGQAFRDTAQCREIVMQYLCLFWGSHNTMYRNYCYWQEVVDSTNQLFAPRPPCRSFCVQVKLNIYSFIIPSISIIYMYILNSYHNGDSLDI